MPNTSLPTFEMGPIRPPSEGGGNSLLLRLTRNCPWGRCEFCYSMFYGRQKFELRNLDDIKKDVLAIKAISEFIRGTSWRLGEGGQLTQAVVAAIISAQPELRSHQSFVTVFNWLHSGGRTVFLQDADSLIMRTPQLQEAIYYLRLAFPEIQRITSYARAKTVYRKSLEELKSLRASGLSRLHVGLETGDDELLERVNKGITAQQHIAAGRKAKQSGFQLSQYVMPDLGGRALSEQHAKNTASVLNAINPDYIRLRPFIPRAGTPMYEEYVAGRFMLSSPHERLRELRTMVESLTVTSRLCFDHFGNSWQGESGQPLFRRDYDGYEFPDEKETVLELIERGLGMDESHHVHAREMVQLPIL